MVIPLSVIIVVWAVFVGVMVLLSLINLFHLVHYGFFTFKSALFSLLYYGTVAIVLFWAIQALGQFDFNQPAFTIGVPDTTFPYGH